MNQEGDLIVLVKASWIFSDEVVTEEWCTTAEHPSYF